MPTKLVKILALTLLLATLVMFVFKVLLGSTLIVDLSSLPTANGVNVYVNNREVLGFNEKSKQFVAQKQIGSKDVLVRVSGYEDFHTKISTLWRGNKLIKPALREADAKKVAQTLTSDIDTSGYTVTSAEYYQDRTWVAYKLQPKDNTNQPLTLVAHYNRQLGEWVVVNSGENTELEPTEGEYQVPDALFEKYFKDSL